MTTQYAIPKQNQLVFWECQWERLKNGNINELDEKEQQTANQVRYFLANCYTKRKRLAPREGLRGGKVETYVFGWASHKRTGYEFKYYDYTSLYPSVSSDTDHPFPTGKVQVLIRQEDLKRLIFREEKVYYFDCGEHEHQVKGLLQLTILAPQNLHIPFLPYRINQPGEAEKSLSALCRTCCEQKNKHCCNHTPRERSFTSVWTLDEIAYALRLGYKIIELHEAYIYHSAKNIFKHFLEALARYKVRPK